LHTALAESVGSAVANLIGGPCNGIPVLGDGPATITCGGVLYTKASDGNYYPGSSGPGPGGFAGTPLDTKQIGQAWHRLMHVYAVEAPHQLRRARAARARLHRLTR